MTPEMQLFIKVISGIVLVISLTIRFFERWYRPSHLLLEDSHDFPSWIGWLGWILMALATLAYVLVDFVVSGG